jgi:hypothetical protein
MMKRFAYGMQTPDNLNSEIPFQPLSAYETKHGERDNASPRLEDTPFICFSLFLAQSQQWFEMMYSLLYDAFCRKQLHV